MSDDPANAIGEAGPDGALGEQLDGYLEALRHGSAQKSPLPASPDLIELQPVVDQLHEVSHSLGLVVQAIIDVGAQQPKDRQPPDRIGKYEIRQKLGRGGQASTFKAYDPELRRHVVLKLYHTARTAAEQERVLKEGQALVRVRSPYVVQCHGSDRHEGKPYLVLEYVPGKNLEQVLQEPSKNNSLSRLGRGQG